MKTSLRTLTLLLFALLLTSLVVACGDDDSDNNTTPDTITEADATEDTTTEADATEDTTTEADATEDTGTVEDMVDDTVTTTCTHNGFTAVAQDAGPFMGAFMYIAQDSLGAPASTLTLELVEPNGGAAAAGTYDLDGDNYADCANCGTISLNCDQDLANCEKGFLATSGVLDITTFGASGEQFTGTLTNAVFVEITLDADFNSTPVEGGDTWCIESYAFDATVQ